ncbi:endonuclease/exonuclease/phosphatase family protein [Planotetraspora sp. A-T 1434]|uniref:endonuclease/exonuclease/phosphatase family protein n=1 Tax=Planotetraspora sp. A-T 1434 TaxID=2979219 RepID=UPI0021C04004|nr:endonuclease/exonuclease/phosphatase family protein [Planotetraspora sp. A-T 1434]MCT9932881.1 endonuclease/exonuclease/phosphatase family protein [Planotetraspora sp. A-T 1434]
MGLFAAAWFAIPFAAIPLSRLVTPRWIQIGGAALLVAARLGLQATGGGPPQLYLASAGVSAGLVFLYGSARTTERDVVPTALMAGLAASMILHMTLDQVDLVWRDGPLPWLAVVMICALFLWSVRLSPPSGDLAPAAVWFVFGPALLLTGMCFGGTGFLVDQTESHSAPFTALSVALRVVALCAAVVYAWTTRWGWWAGLFLVLGVALAEGGVTGVPTLVAAAALGACVGLAGLGTTPGRRNGAALLGGMAVFLVAAFLYYAAYDADLGFPNWPVPVAVAVLVTVIAARTARRHGAEPVRRAPKKWIHVSVSLGLLAGLTTWQTLPAGRETGKAELTLVAYNIRMGFGLRGTLDLDRIAAWARTRHPDVVLLSEVDRGWLLNGGHDDLARIARGLGMRYRFAPAAGHLWGDAVLTNLPVREVTSVPLGRHGHPTGAQAQSIVLSVGGRQVGIVNTHLQAPPGQAPEVAAIVRRLAAGALPRGMGFAEPRPVILAGDLNTTPSDPEMRVLEAAGLSDPLIALGDPLTSPADRPVKRIDHVLIGRGLEAIEADAPRVPFSDHLPVVVRLRLT